MTSIFIEIFFFSELYERNLAQLNIMKLMKTETASLITGHLLSQLLYNPTNHIIDSSLSGDQPHDCGAPVQYGYTNFGKICHEHDVCTYKHDKRKRKYQQILK